MLSSSAGDVVLDLTAYRSFVGTLQYLTLTQPVIAHAVQQMCLYMHSRWEPHLNLIKRILQYVKGTLDYNLQLHMTPPTSLMAYSDADWAGYSDKQCSTFGYYIYLGDNMVSWSSKHQAKVSHSSTEVVYCAVAHAVADYC